MGEVVKSPAEIFAAAISAASAAREAEMQKLVPMVVGTAIGLSDEIDYNQKTYFVQGGPCGFASVLIKPARGAFVNWLKKQPDKWGRPGLGYKAYGGGYSLSSHNFVEDNTSLCQSLQLNEVICRAAADVLRENGINCYVESRMD